ncbi:MAG: hypothetical protein MJ208_01590 [Bacilli bacterium]|nr:hypothetical protein [Bacilli bacterium]
MKKHLTFSNIIAALGIMNILFYFIPAAKITVNGDIYDTTINLFTASFGGGINFDYGGRIDSYHLIPCAGLIIAFIFAIIAIILSGLKVKNRLATLLASPFYITAGTLIGCIMPLLSNTNLNTSLPPQFNFYILGGALTVASIFCILGLFALIDFVGTVAKPKEVQPQL